MIVIGIGAQKAGTTWLTAALKNNPDLLIAPQNEVHFFDRLDGYFKKLEKSRHLMRKYEPWVQSFRRLTENRQAEKAEAIAASIALASQLFLCESIPDYLKVVGEALERTGRPNFLDWTPSYGCVSRDMTKRMAAELPSDTRIVLSLRDPVERVVSAFHHERRIGTVPHKDVETFLNTPQCYIRTDYGTILRNYFDSFGRDRVTVVFYEEISHPDRAETDFVELQRGMGCTPIALPQPPRGPSRKELEPQVRAALLDRYGFVYEQVEELLGRVPDFWLAGLEGGPLKETA